MSWKLGEVVVIRECNDGKPRIGFICDLFPCRVALANPKEFALGKENFSVADIPCETILFKDIGIRERHALFPELLDRDMSDEIASFWFCFSSFWVSPFLDKKKPKA